MSRSLVVNLLGAALAAIAAATVVGVVALWPEERTVERPEGFVAPTTHAAEVLVVEAVDCRVPGASGCARVVAAVLEGERAGTQARFTVGDGGSATRLSPGDRIRVYENRLPEGAVLGGVEVDEWVLADFERRAPLGWLAAGFALLVVVTGRWRGFRALLGLVGSLVVVVFFVVPAILDGQAPLPVALFGALAAMLVTIPLAHGLGPKTVAACLGTAAALALTLVLAQVFTRLAHLTGLSSDEAVFLRATAGDVSITGLLLAGMVIGALGVLDDTTVTQASTVFALRRADPTQSFGALSRAALDVGHDHIAATVNTLVLAYAGASLPVLLIFNLGDVSFGDAVNSEAVAAEIVAMLVGSIGLIAAVPITTALAALLAVRLRPDALADEHAHVH